MSTRCIQPGCGNWAFEDGLCRTHMNQLREAPHNVADGAVAVNPFASLVSSAPPVVPRQHAHYVPLAPDTLKLPVTLQSYFKELGISLKSMMQDLPECMYMGQIDMMLRDLMFREPPVHPYEIIKVKDPSAFTNFFSGASKDVFSKWLVLFDLNEKILNMTETGDRFPAEHYVPPVVALLMQRESPFFVINKCLDVLTGLHNAGESALRHMCKIAALPQYLAGLVDQLCRDEAARNAVGSYGMMADTCIELLCNIVIKCCAEHSLQVSYCFTFLFNIMIGATN
jgi:hypothetical protein